MVKIIFQKGNMVGFNTRFQKGHKDFVSKEVRKRVGLKLKGRKKPEGFRMGHYTSEDTKKKISLANKGKKRSEETSKKQGKTLKKKWKTDSEYREKMSKVHKGKLLGNKSPLWKGGVSYKGYTREFKQNRDLIRQRDNFRCQQCFRHQDELRTKTNKKYRLDVHHIDYNKKNNNPDNLTSLCRNCHAQTNFKREDWTNYFEKK